MTDQPAGRKNPITDKLSVFVLPPPGPPEDPPVCRIDVALIAAALALFWLAAINLALLVLR